MEAKLTLAPRFRQQCMILLFNPRYRWVSSLFQTAALLMSILLCAEHNARSIAQADALSLPASSGLVPQPNNFPRGQ